MKRTLGALAGLLVLTALAFGQARFAPYQINGAPIGGGGLPAGVTLIQPDGGTTFHATNGFTTATKPFTFCVTTPPPSCTGITYTTGWDDPKYFPIGWFLEYIVNGQSDINLWLAAYTNGSYAGIAAPQAGQLQLLKDNGMSNIGSFQQSGQSIILDRKYDDETKGMFTWDEPPSYEIGWVWAIQGFPSTTFSAHAGAGFTAAQNRCTITTSAFTYGFIGGTVDAHAAGSFFDVSGATLIASGYTTEPIRWFTGSGNSGTYPVSAVSTTSTGIALTFSGGATATGNIICNILTVDPGTVTGTIGNGNTVTGTGITGGTTVSFGTGAGTTGTYAACTYNTSPAAPTCTDQTVGATAGATTNAFQFVATTVNSPTSAPVLATMGYADGRLQVSEIPYFSGTGISANTLFTLFDVFGGSGQSQPVNALPWTYDFNFGTPVGRFNTTVTQAAVPGLNTAEFNTDSMDTRFNWSNVTNGFSAFASLHSSQCPGLFYGVNGCVDTNPAGGNRDLKASYILGTAVTSPGGKSRTIDFFGFDFYWSVLGRCQNIYGSNCSLTMSNLYNCCTINDGFTQAQAAKGTHYGDQGDMLRQLYPGGVGRPLINPLETSQCICGVPYDNQPVEFQWAFWASVIHGVRGIGYFGQNGGLATNGCNGGQFGDTIYCTYTRTSQEVTISGGSISGNVLTVPNQSSLNTQNPTGNGQFSRGQLGPGMRATLGVTGASTILQQLTFGQGAEATYSATFSGTNKVTMTVTGTSCPGTNCIQVPSMLTAQGVGFTDSVSGCQTNPFIRAQTSGPTGGDGTYTIDPDVGGACARTAGPKTVISYPVASFTASFSTTTNPQDTMTVTGAQGTIVVPSSLIGANVQSRGQLYGGGSAIIRAQTSGTPGGNGVYTVDSNAITPGTAQALGAPGGPGTYLISGGTGSGTLKYKQSGWDCSGCTSAPTITTDISNVDGVTAIDKLILSMAPVINSPFAKGFLTSQSPDRYMFDRVNSQNCNTGSNTHNIVSPICGLATGIDSAVKWFTGTPYTAITGDTITTNTFYIIATTANPETDTNISATFTICGACAFTQARVIGEGRDIAISGGSFNDTFPFAWTTKIYKLH